VKSRCWQRPIERLLFSVALAVGLSARMMARHGLQNRRCYRDVL